MFKADKASFHEIWPDQYGFFFGTDTEMKGDGKADKR